MSEVKVRIRKKAEKKDKKVFDRVEKKCLITKEQKKKLVKIMQEHMTEDDYFRSTIFNIYFDTENNDLIQQSIEQPVFKEKLRARSYEGYDKVFIEIKTKLRGKEKNLGYKRRVRVTKKDYERFVKKGTSIHNLMFENADDQNDYQVATEIDYLTRHFNLRPKILVMYTRESYSGENGLRITFDGNLKYRTRNLNFRKSKNDKVYFSDEKNIIMEIKAKNAWPLWLVHALTEEKIFANRFSKIGKIYEKIRKEGKNV